MGEVVQLLLPGGQKRGASFEVLPKSINWRELVFLFSHMFFFSLFFLWLSTVNHVIVGTSLCVCVRVCVCKDSQLALQKVMMTLAYKI